MAIDLWMACETQEAIAEQVGVDHTTVKKWVEDFVENLTPKESTKFRFQDGFDPPLQASIGFKNDSLYAHARTRT